MLCLVHNRVPPLATLETPNPSIPFSNLGGLDPAAGYTVVIGASAAIGNIHYDAAASLAKTTGTISGAGGIAAWPAAAYAAATESD